MQNRIFIHLVVVVLFAIAQIGIAMHSVEHIGGHSHTVASHSDSTQDETSAVELCGQCLAQSHAHFANFQGSFVWPSLEKAQHLSTHYVARVTFDLAEYFSARGPPATA